LAAAVPQSSRGEPGVPRARFPGGHILVFDEAFSMTASRQSPLSGPSEPSHNGGQQRVVLL